MHGRQRHPPPTNNAYDNRPKPPSPNGPLMHDQSSQEPFVPTQWPQPCTLRQDASCRSITCHCGYMHGDEAVCCSMQRICIPNVDSKRVTDDRGEQQYVYARGTIHNRWLALDPTQWALEQLHAIDIVLNTNDNVFMTGGAGVGKSVLLARMIHLLRTCRRHMEATCCRRPQHDVAYPTKHAKHPTAWSNATTSDHDDDDAVIRDSWLAVTSTTSYAAISLAASTSDAFNTITPTRVFVPPELPANHVITWCAHTDTSNIRKDIMDDDDSDDGRVDHKSDDDEECDAMPDAPSTPVSHAPTLPLQPTTAHSLFGIGIDTFGWRAFANYVSRRETFTAAIMAQILTKLQFHSLTVDQLMTRPSIPTFLRDEYVKANVYGLWLDDIEYQRQEHYKSDVPAERAGEKHAKFRFDRRYEFAISRMKRLECWILDEVSMMCPFYFTAIGWTVARVRAMDMYYRLGHYTLPQIRAISQTPFGGVRLIFVGDFMQLPPVIDPRKKYQLVTDQDLRRTATDTPTPAQPVPRCAAEPSRYATFAKRKNTNASSSNYTASTPHTPSSTIEPIQWNVMHAVYEFGNLREYTSIVQSLGLLHKIKSQSDKTRTISLERKTTPNNPFGAKTLRVQLAPLVHSPASTMVESTASWHHLQERVAFPQYAFQTRVWQLLNFVPIVLKTIYRQAQDLRYAECLNRLRHGVLTLEDTHLLYGRIKTDTEMHAELLQLDVTAHHDDFAHFLHATTGCTTYRNIAKATLLPTRIYPRVKEIRVRNDEELSNQIQRLEAATLGNASTPPLNVLASYRACIIVGPYTRIQLQNALAEMARLHKQSEDAMDVQHVDVNVQDDLKTRPPEAAQRVTRAVRAYKDHYKTQFCKKTPKPKSTGTRKKKIAVLATDDDFNTSVTAPSQIDASWRPIKLVDSILASMVASNALSATNSEYTIPTFDARTLRVATSMDSPHMARLLKSVEHFMVSQGFVQQTDILQETASIAQRLNSKPVRIFFNLYEPHCLMHRAITPTQALDTMLVASSIHDQVFDGGEASSQFRASTLLDLCYGAQVRLTSTICIARGLGNGSRGVVVGFYHVRTGKFMVTLDERHVSTSPNNVHGCEHGNKHNTSTCTTSTSAKTVDAHRSSSKKQPKRVKASQLARRFPYLPVVVFHGQTAAPVRVDGSQEHACGIVSPTKMPGEIIAPLVTRVADQSRRFMTHGHFSCQRVWWHESQAMSLDVNHFTSVNAPPDATDLNVHVIALPLELEWAITAHASQGCTRSLVRTRIDRSMLNNQAYVILSRVTSPQGLFLESFDDHGIRACPIAVEFDRHIAEDAKRRAMDNMHQHALHADEASDALAQSVI